MITDSDLVLFLCCRALVALELSSDIILLSLIAKILKDEPQQHVLFFKDFEYWVEYLKNDIFIYKTPSTCKL